MLRVHVIIPFFCSVISVAIFTKFIGMHLDWHLSNEVGLIVQLAYLLKYTLVMIHLSTFDV